MTTTIIIALLSLCVGYLLGRYVFNPRAKSVASDITNLQIGSARLEQENEGLKAERIKLEGEKDRSASQLVAITQENARLQERERNLTKDLEAKNCELKDTQQKLQTEFENIANRILEATTQKLTETSQTKLADLLNPLRERINDFQKKIEDVYASEGREFASLKTEIGHIVEVNKGLGKQAENLSNALKNDPQMRGRWGELVLERILNASGLVEGREYITQGRGLSLKDDDGRLQKPDVLVRLPESRHMVIDSKVPLVSYDAYIACANEDERPALLKEFMASVKRHIDGLSGKKYQDNQTIISHDLVLMFLPIEGALATACNFEGDLFEYGWTRRVVIVGPSTLLMTLRTIESIWRYERQNENAQNIANLAADLYDKLAGSIDAFKDVGDKLEKASQAHTIAMGRLGKGKGNAISLAERFKKYGVKPKKTISQHESDETEVAILEAANDQLVDALISENAALDQ